MCGGQNDREVDLNAMEMKEMDDPAVRDYPGEMDECSKLGHIGQLEYWRREAMKRGFTLAYTCEALRLASRAGRIDVLTWWKKSRLPLLYPAYISFAGGRTYKNDRVMAWWKANVKKSDLPLFLMDPITRPSITLYVAKKNIRKAVATVENNGTVETDKKDDKVSCRCCQDIQWKWINGKWKWTTEHTPRESDNDSDSDAGDIDSWDRDSWMDPAENALENPMEPIREEEEEEESIPPVKVDTKGSESTPPMVEGMVCITHTTASVSHNDGAVVIAGGTPSPVEGTMDVTHTVTSASTTGVVFGGSI